MTLPSDIQEIFLQTITGRKSILEFEEWLYKDKRFEAILSREDYLKSSRSSRSSRGSRS